MISIKVETGLSNWSNKTVKRCKRCKSSDVAVEIDFGSFANEELIGFISCSVNTCQKGRAPES